MIINKKEINPAYKIRVLVGRGYFNEESQFIQDPFFELEVGAYLSEIVACDKIQRDLFAGRIVDAFVKKIKERKQELQTKR